MTKHAICATIALAGWASLSGCSQRDQEMAPPVETPAASTPLPSSAQAAPDALSCLWPVKEDDTAAAVIRRFGAAAKREELDGPEGTTMPGLVLWGDDPRRRIELLVDEEAPADRIAGWRIADGSGWSFAGLRVGDSLDRLTAVNSGPFRFYGFAWDYGGYVTDWRGGELDELAGGCGLSVRLSPGSDELPDTVMGEGELSSDAPAVVKVGARVAEISVAFGDGE